MCGIVGYVGSGEASEFLIDGLRRLEYRGYDSAGIAVYENGKIQIVKKKGGLANLEAVLKEQIKHLSEHIEYKENKLNTINKSIESKQEELDRINTDLKKKEFWINFKNVWINKWIAFVSAGFLLVFIGGFLGWPTYKVMNSVFKIIRSVF